MVRSAVESYNDTHAHTRTPMDTRTNTVHGCHKDKRLKPGCRTVVASPWTAAGYLRKQQQRAVKTKKMTFGEIAAFHQRHVRGLHGPGWLHLVSR